MGDCVRGSSSREKPDGNRAEDRGESKKETKITELFKMFTFHDRCIAWLIPPRKAGIKVGISVPISSEGRDQKVGNPRKIGG